MNKTNSDAHLNFFMHCKRYLDWKAFKRGCLYWTMKLLPIFKNIWNPLSKLGALTVYSNIVFYHTYLCTIIITYVISVGIFMYSWYSFERYHVPVTPVTMSKPKEKYICSSRKFSFFFLLTARRPTKQLFIMTKEITFSQRFFYQHHIFTIETIYILYDTGHYVQFLTVLDTYYLLYFWDFFGSEGTYLRYLMFYRYWIGTYYCSFWNLNLESGSFSYLRNSVCKYIRNFAEFREIPGSFTAKNTAEFRGIPRNFVCFSKNSVFRRKSKTHFRGHPTCSPQVQLLWRRLGQASGAPHTVKKG